MAVSLMVTLSEHWHSGEVSTFLLFLFIALFIVEFYSMEYQHNLFIHSPTDGPLRCFQYLAIMNTAAT